MKVIKAYVDGSVLSIDGGLEHIGYGVVFVYRKKVKDRLFGRVKETSYFPYKNVSGEVFAVAQAVAYAVSNCYDYIEIYHDCRASRDWAEGHSKPSNQMSKSYRDFLDYASKFVEIKFVKVQAHSGDFYNNYADALAKAGCYSDL